MGDKIIICGKTLDDAILFLDDLLKDKDIGGKIRLPSVYVVFLKDNSQYSAIEITDSFCGFPNDLAYVQNGVDEEIINLIIRPILTRSELPYDERIIYFD